MPRRKTFETYFGDVADPRVRRCRRHVLHELLVIGLLSVLCGGKGWEEMSAFAVAKREWLRERLGVQLAEGVPCSDTFRRLFARLDPQAFAKCMRSWASALGTQSQGRLLSVDGKTLRHSFDTAAQQKAIHMVRVWAAANRLVLAALPTDAKSNEIPAVRTLLGLLDLAGAIVSADAEHAQKDTVRQIRQQGGDYLLGLKDNQPTLKQAAEGLLERLDGHSEVAAEWQGRAWGRVVSHATEHDKGHGRIETRRTTVVTLAQQDPDWEDVQQEWPDLRTLVRVVRTRREGQQDPTTETAYFLSSVVAPARQMGRLVRAHWRIENSLHHTLDVTFREDDCRIRREHGPANLAVLRDTALNALNRLPQSEGSIRRRQVRAGWDNDYLTRILAVMAPAEAYG